MDDRLVLKLAYFRLDILPRPQPDFSNAADDHRRFLTFAPEQLRSTNVYRGSKEADIYSYGHVITEILTEAGPFQTEMEIAHYSAKGQRVLYSIKMRVNCEDCLKPFKTAF